jgi:hypothetical protein
MNTYKTEIQFFDNIWERKPQDWSDCDIERVPSMPQSVRNWILTLPKFYFPLNSKPIRDFEESVFEGVRPPRYFVAEVGEAQYLVSTEGYNFARYAVQIRAV